MSNQDRKNEGCGAGKDRYETSVMDFLDREMSVSSASVDPTDAQADDVDLLVDRILRQAIAAAEEKAVPVAPRPDAPPLSIVELPGEPRVSTIEKGHDFSVGLSVESRIESQHSGVPSPAMHHHWETSVPLPVFAMPVRKPAWQGRVFLVSGAAFCLLAGAGVVYLTNTQGRSTVRLAPPVSAPAPTTPAKAEVPVLPAAAADSGSTVPSTSDLTVRSESIPRAPARRKIPGLADNAMADPAANAAVANTPQAAGKTNAGGKVIGSSIADAKPAPGGAAATNPAAELPAQPPGIVVVPAASQNEAPPAATFAQLDLNSNTSLQDLATLRKPAIQTPPPPRRATPPTVISRVMPVYPELARRSRTWGTVVVEVQIDEQGRPVKAVAESGPAILHDEAVNAVLRWRFRPATLDGVNVSGTTRVSIVFTNQNPNGGQR